MSTFQELRRKAKLDASQYPSVRLAVLGDCATQLLSTAVKGCGYEKGLNLEVFDADYNQIDAQLIDPGSELYRYAPEAILLVMCAEKLYEVYCGTPLPGRTGFAQEMYQRIEGYWENAFSHQALRILQCNFVEIDDGVFGSFAGKVESSFLFQLRKLNVLLMEGSQRYKNVYIVDLCSLQGRIGRETFFDEKYYYSAKTPISLTALPFAAGLAVDVLNALQGRMKKCVVLDLDNTLWGGVIGDDGLSGIEIGELGTGHAFSEFQMWLRELKNRGVILAVCSKNNEDTAKEPFEKHPEMVLRLSDISIFVANWEDKASNIRLIQQTLNIGMDSMVFLDDNPFERNMVRGLIPEILVPELPEDPAQYLTALKRMNLFETVSFSEEDTARTGQYQAEAGRALLQRQYASLDEYLESLEMKAESRPFDEFHYPRIAQLTQRSNQFNLRTVRYTEAEIAAAAREEGTITRYFTLRDKFGGHGLISVVIMKRQDEQTLFLDTWLMSCRVLKRGMEEFIINAVMRAAKEAGCRRVVGEYLKTPKNAMVEHIYERLGFHALDDHTYEALVDSFTAHKTYIMEE